MVSLFGKCGLLPIGVHVDTDIVRMVQLRRTGKGIELLAAKSAPMASSPSSDATKRLDAAAACIRHLIASSAFKGRRAVLSLPSDQTIIQHAKVPKLKPEQITEILRMELDKTVPGTTADMVIRYTIARDVVGASKAQQEVIAVAARRTTIASYLALADRSGLDCVGLDAEACAVVECFGHLLRREEDVARALLFIHIGNSSTQVVCSHGRNLAFARNLPIGGVSFDGAVSAGLGVSLEEARAKRRVLATGQGNVSETAHMLHLLEAKLDEAGAELAHCMNYYSVLFRDRPIELVIFVGDQAHDRTICQNLAKRLNLRAKVGNPLLGIQHADKYIVSEQPDSHEPHPGWTVSVGLSLGDV